MISLPKPTSGIGLALAAGVALFVTGCGRPITGAASFVAPMGPVGTFRVPVTPVAEQRFAGIIQQQYDFSCGSAALATLLRYHYQYAVDEELTFRGMWAEGDRAQIRAVGFSLLDMKRWLASHAIAADGYEVSLDTIADTGIPGIALIAIGNYRHFVVVKGVSRDEVLLGDPSAGLVVMPRETFETAWNGVYFVLSDDQERGKLQFNRAGQWSAFSRAPVGGGFSDPVSQQALSLTAPFFRDIS